LTDAELAKAGIHLSLIGGVIDGIEEMLGLSHVVAAWSAVYEAWPEIKVDVIELIKDLAALRAKIRALE
jgi:hypothetical protein